MIAINIFFVYGTISDLDLSTGPIAAIVLVAIIYLLFVFYLAIHMIASITESNLIHVPFIQKYVMNDCARTLTNV